MSHKIAKLGKLGEVAQGLMLICEFPQVCFATFQFTQSRPDQYGGPFVKTTYPEKWVNHYLQHNLMHSDPVVRHSFNSEKPFFWSEVKLTNDEQLMMLKAISFGLSSVGYSVPTKDVGPYRGLFSINADKNADGDWEKIVVQDEIQWKEVALKIHKMAREEVDPGNEYTYHFSKREMECLYLIADGKTYREVANIFGISEHTVRGYFRSLRFKLNCVTLAQVVGKAKTLGLI